MEKLILRGVMWGVEKVPDEWFDKIPGGYYKAKELKAEEEHRKEEKSEKKSKHHSHKSSEDMKKRRSRRHSDDEYDEDDYRRRRDDEGYRSEGHGRRTDDLRKSYDGQTDYDNVNDRPRRKRSRQRHRENDDDRYGYNDGHGRSSRRHAPGLDGVEYGNGTVPPFQQQDGSMRGSSSITSPQMGAATAGATGAATAPGWPQNSWSNETPSSGQNSNGVYQSSSSNSYNSQGTDPKGNLANQSTSTLRGGMATGYVPYAHLYGGPTNAQPQPGYAPPPSDSGSVQPNYMNQVAPPVARPQEGYQQNPYAQDAPPGNQPGYMSDPYWQQRQQYADSQVGGQYDGRYDDRRRLDPYDDDRSSDTYTQRRRSRRGRWDRSRSDSRSRYSDDDSYRPRRARSERRRDHRDEQALQTRGKNTGRSIGPFDTSQRGLGYSAVGALAGGLIGSEFNKGKGQVPTGVGTIVGAIIANAFQARERKKEDARNTEYSRDRGRSGHYSD